MGGEAIGGGAAEICWRRERREADCFVARGSEVYSGIPPSPCLFPFPLRSACRTPLPTFASAEGLDEGWLVLKAVRKRRSRSLGAVAVGEGEEGM